jgi:hypothetical protein
VWRGGRGREGGGVGHELFVDASAPAASSNSTMPACPLCAALIKGVQNRPK